MAPLQGRTGAFLILTGAAARVRVQLISLPGLLYRITTPPDSGLAPVVSVTNGRVRAALRQTGKDGPDEVRLVLNRDVRWDLRFPKGAGEQQLDLARGRVSRVDLGASGLVSLNLPRPTGTVGVTLTGAAGTALVTAPPGTPVRFGLDQGAGVATTPWSGALPALPGAVLAERGWAAARDKYLLRARASIGLLTVRRSA